MPWVENVCKQHNLGPDLEVFKQTFLNFVGHRLCQGSNVNDIEDVKKHFQNWLVIVKDKQKRNKSYQQYTANRAYSSRPSYEERMEGYQRVIEQFLNEGYEAQRRTVEDPDDLQPF